jgi:hypothetical protein
MRPALPPACPALAANAQDPDPRFKDTPMLPGLPRHVHDPDLPHPPVVTPPSTPGGMEGLRRLLRSGKGHRRRPADGPLRSAGARPIQQLHCAEGRWPPLANPGRKPGEWNSCDIVFEAPRRDGDKLLKPAIVTVFFNGVVVRNHKEPMGPMVYRNVAQYVAQPNENSLVPQNHHNPVRYRNIWLRRPGDQ